MKINKYTLESYMIIDDPELIAIEAETAAEKNGSDIGTTKLTREELELIAAIRRQDAEEANKIKARIDARREKLAKAAKREQNMQVVKAINAYVAQAGSIANMATSLINSHRVNKAQNAVSAAAAAGPTVDSSLIKKVNALQGRANKLNAVFTGINLGTNLISML